MEEKLLRGNEEMEKAMK
jgi:hypothetical protein